MQKKVLISGVGFSQGGVGRLMEKLAPEAKLRGFSVLSRRMVSISELIRQRKYFKLFYELFLRLVSLIVFKYRTFFVKGDTVLILHPQSIGYKAFIRLMKNNSLYLYVMDSSFFCMMSYNYNRETGTECLRCVGNPLNSMKSCTSWPGLARKKTAINYLDLLLKNSGRVVFLAQTKLQENLLKNHFGSKINCHVVGMELAELSLDTIKNIAEKSDDKPYFDLVYHGSLHPAKGFLYFLRISKLLPNLNIFIPASRKLVISLLGDANELEHITFEECTWETGLMDAVKSTRLVVNPSLWSSPVEGAFLKSIAYNGNVAVVETKYGFPQEIVQKNIILNLSNNPVDAAREINEFLDSGVNYSGAASKWLINFYKTNKTQNVFSSIESTS